MEDTHLDVCVCVFGGGGLEGRHSTHIRGIASSSISRILSIRNSASSGSRSETLENRRSLNSSLLGMTDMVSKSLLQ